ncbi:MAG: DUF4831 family protein [Prevotella sp.]|nr:DUF4831 family protein [Prevotella sp.]
MQFKKHSLTTLVLVLLSLTAFAQTSVSPYRPGATEEGAVYCLPKTAIRVSVLIEKCNYQPGDFAKYADRYLRLRDVKLAPETTYRILSISQSAFGIADTTKVYAVEFNAKTSAANIALSPEGILLAINATPTKVNGPQPFTPARKAAPIDPRQYLSQEILAAGSTAKMAELTAQDIYDLRESRNLLVRGQADNMPKDGEQLRLMLSQLDAQDQAMTGLFAGTSICDTIEHVLTIAPNSECANQLLFRFSQKLGLVDNDDLSGEPYYITIADLHAAPKAEGDNKKKDKRVDGVYVNVPGKLRSTITDGVKTLCEDEFPAAQFGNTELLSGALFNKHFATHVWINGTTGALERLEAEEPK